MALHWWGADYPDAIRAYAIEANTQGWLLASPELRSQHTASIGVQRNVIDIVNYMRSNYRVDSSRVYLTGSSMGGMIAATTAAKYPDVFAAIVEEKGPTNLSNWFSETNSWRASIMEREIGHNPWQAPFEYQRRSSESMAMNLKHVAVAIVHGTSDTVVFPSHAQGLYDAMVLFDPDHLEPIFWYDGDHDTASPYGPDWILEFLGRWTLNKVPADLNIRTDESKSFYWLSVTQGGWAPRWTSVEAAYDAYFNSIRAMVSDAAHSPIDLGFDLAAMGLSTGVPYVVEDYNVDTGDFRVYAALPVGGHLPLSFVDGNTHELSIYPGDIPPVVEHVYRQNDGGQVVVEDTYLYAYEPGANYQDRTTVKLNYNSTYTPLFRFDLSDVPSEAHIKSAVLRLYVHGRSEDQDVDANAHVLLQEWDVEQATWRNATASEQWIVQGANGLEDRRETATDVAKLGSPREWRTWNLLGAVEEWVQHTAENYGVILKGQGAPSVWYELASSEYYALTKRPELVVKYVVPTATLQPTETPTTTPMPSQTPTPTLTSTPTQTGAPSVTASASLMPSVTPTTSPTPQTAVIRGYVWNDVNENGIKDESEQLLSGATVILSDLLRREVDRYVTAADGWYRFVVNAPAEYHVEEINPRGYVSTGVDLYSLGEVVVGSVIEKNFGDRPALLYLPMLMRG